MSDATSIQRKTQQWLERAVIGLNLCPFAKAVHVKGQIHYAVSDAEDRDGLLTDLQAELQTLHQLSPDERDTTLLIAPRVFPDFWDFNAFLPSCDRALKKLGLGGEIQIASFHPQFQFAGSEANDVTNNTNRAPFPILHLLREASIDRAVQAFPNPEVIFEANMATLQALGADGWQALQSDGIPNEA